MRLCKVEICGKKYHSRGYCNTHYQNWRYHNMQGVKQHLQRLGRKHYHLRRKEILKYKKENYLPIPTFMGNKVKHQKQGIYTDGFTEELKPMLKKIKDKVLKDCIKNPAKYLK